MAPPTLFLLVLALGLAALGSPLGFVVAFVLAILSEAYSFRLSA